MDLKEIEKKISDLKKDTAKSEIGPNQEVSGSKFVIELFAGLIVGSFLGWTLDRHLGTIPLFLFFFSIFGICGGCYGFYKDYWRQQNKNKD